MAKRKITYWYVTYSFKDGSLVSGFGAATVHFYDTDYFPIGLSKQWLADEAELKSEQMIILDWKEITKEQADDFKKYG